MPLQLYKIASVEVGSAGASSIDFTNIPQGYTDLKVVISARSNASAPQDNGLITFNGSSSSFSYIRLYGDGVGPGAGSSGTTGNNINVVYSGATALANTFNNSELYIPNYTSSINKVYSLDSSQENNTAEAYNFFVVGLWSNTAAISSIGFAPRTGTAFTQYSTATLYGIL